MADIEKVNKNEKSDLIERKPYCHSCQYIMWDYDCELYCVRHSESVGLKDEACGDYVSQNCNRHFIQEN